MYSNPFDLCDCSVPYCNCAGSLRSYEPHYACVLEHCRPRRVFEWGPGENTRMALAAGAEVFSIEPLLKWVRPLPPDEPKLAVLVTPTTSPMYLSLHGREESEVFFVDSRRRSECLDLIREQAAPTAVVCLHDAQRTRYDAALRRFVHVVFLERSFAIASMTPLPDALCPPATSIPVRTPVEHATGNPSPAGPAVKRSDGKTTDKTATVRDARMLAGPRSSGIRPRRILFASYHCLLDPASGAALSTRDMWEMLAARGWPVRVLCGPRLDRPGESPHQLLNDLRIPFDRKESREGPAAFSVLHVAQNGVPLSVYTPDRDGEPTPEEVAVFETLYERLLEQWRPDVLVTYGGQWVGARLMETARRRGVRVVFSLRNFAYKSAGLFRPTDAILVPSRFSAEHYRRALGLDCTPIPSPVIRSRVLCEPDQDRRFATFVNPEPAKGVKVFARIAADLARRRPDIPLLAVESRSGAEWPSRCGIDLAGANLHRMMNTPDPRDFYRVSKLVLTPSLGHESFGRVPVEAMLNGIPVLASDRGALPETIGDAGFLFRVPTKYNPRSAEPPTSLEVLPWVETIIRLWDDEPLYAQASLRARAAAEAFREDRVADQYEAFFHRVIGTE